MTIKTILVTGPQLAPEAEDYLAKKGYKTVHTPPYADSDVIAKYLNDTHAVGIVSRMGRLDANVFDAGLPNLKVIAKHGVGVDNIDCVAAGERGIPVLVAYAANAVSVAEHTIALLLAVSKRIPALDQSLRLGRWEKPGFRGRELAGSTLGLLGMGATAQATAKIAKGLDLKVIGFDPFAADSVFSDSQVERVTDLEQMLGRSHVVSLHCPLTDETREVINARTLALMPRGSYIVNTARGGLIDEAALLAAVRSGLLAGAGLDTFSKEPPPPDHPFFSEPSIILTPHIGGVTEQANSRVGLSAVQGIVAVLEGNSLPARFIANKQFLAQDAISEVSEG